MITPTRCMTAIRQSILMVKANSVERTIRDISNGLQYVADRDTQDRMVKRRECLRRELAKLRAEYQVTLMPGERRIFADDLPGTY